MTHSTDETALGDTLSLTRDLVLRLRAVQEETLRLAPSLRLIFVTNVRTGSMTEVVPNGLSHVAQYYTLREANGVIESLQSLGLTVESYFDEESFIAAAPRIAGRTDGRQPIIYTAAEGGSGSGRRALIPALCRLLSLPVLNSGPHACSLARHKWHANAVMRHAGVRVPETWMNKGGTWLASARPPDGSRVIVKPTYESMCLGVDDASVCFVDQAFDGFVAERSLRFGQPMVVQEFISGEEVGVPLICLGQTRALPAVVFRRSDGTPFAGSPRTFAQENLEHDVKLMPYVADSRQYVSMQRQAIAAFDALEMAGVGRIDFRVDADGRAWAYDTNESPPPLAATSYALSMSMLGFGVEEMLATWIGACLLEAKLISGV